MTSEKLYINGIEIDLKPNTVSQTFQVNDLAELKDRQTSYSNRIKVPFTPKNHKALNYLSIVGNNSRIPYEKPKAKYIVDGIELVSEGFAVVRKSVNGNYYDVAIYSGNISLFEVISDKLVSELDYINYNHDLNASVWSNSLTNTEGYIYAVGAFGAGTITPVAIEYQAPSLFSHTVWKEIFEQAGFTYSGAIFDDASFKSELLPMSKGYDVANVNETVEGIGSVAGTQISFNETGMVSQTSYAQNFNLPPSSALTDLTYNGTSITVNYDGVLRLTLNSTWTRQYGSGSINFKKNGSSFRFETITANGSITNEVITMTVQNGDVITVELKGLSDIISQGEPTQAIDISADCNISFQRITGGMFIDFSIMTPDIKQTDFLKDLMQRYGMVFRNTGQNHYEFKTLEELLNDRAGAENWSDKLSILNEEEYKFGDYGQFNKAKYKYTSEDSVQFQTLDGEFSVTNLNIKRDNDLFTSVHTVSEKSILTLQGHELFVVPIWEKDDDDNIINKVIPTRIFKLKTTANTATGQFFEPANSVNVSNVPVLSLDNCSMQYFLNNYYPAFNRILNAPKKRKDYFFLSVMDAYKLDFFKLKRIDQLGQYYYLNKVSNFKKGKLTVCEMIQVNDLTFNQPPDQLGTRTLNVTNDSFRLLTLSDFTDTEPPYSDPEFDAPETIRITSFGNADVIIKNNGVQITSETDIPVNSMNITIEDLGNRTEPHSATFNFKIQSFGSTAFSESTGTITANVIFATNNAPIADAGADDTLEYDSTGTGQGSIQLNGNASSDPDGDLIYYLWLFEGSVPSSVTMTGKGTATPTISVNDPDGLDNGVVITVKLKVTDTGGLYDEDTVQITLQDNGNNP